MSQRIVNRLEIVEIEKKDGDRCILTARADNSVFDTVTEEDPVSQFCQGVVKRLVGKLVFEGFALRDVANYAAVKNAFRRFPRGERDLEREFASILLHAFKFGR